MLVLVDEAAEISLLVNHVHPFGRKAGAHEVVAGGVGPHAISHQAVILVRTWGYFPSVIESYTHSLGHVNLKGNASQGRDSFAIPFVGCHAAIGIIACTQSPCRI